MRPRYPPAQDLVAAHGRAVSAGGVRRNRARPASGFTLVELLIALAIVAVLSALAWPSYSAVIQRAQRNDGRFALLKLQQLQERHYSTHLRYADRLGSGADGNTLPAAAHSDRGLYQLALTASADGQRYTAFATVRPDGPQSRDRDCQQLAVDQDGERRSATSAGVWSDADAHRCWR
jgi:type IV pilus assembly protein PilE